MELKNAVPALVITFISSIILLGSAADLCNQVGSECAGKEAYAVAQGVLSTLLCLIMLGLVAMGRLSSWLAAGFGMFLTVWWSFGVGFNTGSGGPFSTIGNGYFSSWICLFGSMFFTVVALNVARDLEGRNIAPISVIFVASVVEFACAANVCTDRDGPCTNQYGFAVAVGVVSTVIVFLYWLGHQFDLGVMEKLGVVTGAVLFILWCCGAGFNTSYSGPFNITNACTAGNGYSLNGYFATWVAFFAALYFVIHETPFIKKAVDRVMKPGDEGQMPPTPNIEVPMDGGNPVATDTQFQQYKSSY